MRLRLSRSIFDVPPLSAGPFDREVRAVGRNDATALAALLLEAYRGTPDDEGEGPQAAAEEIERVFGGAYGPFDADVSECTVRSGAIVAATLVTHFQGAPMIAHTLVARAWQRQGLARAGILRVLARLRGAGHERVRLAVNPANVPAHRLYESLGFALDP